MVTAKSKTIPATSFVLSRPGLILLAGLALIGFAVPLSARADTQAAQTGGIQVCPQKPGATLSSIDLYAGTPSPDNSNMIPPDNTSDTSTAPSNYSLPPEYPRPIIAICGYTGAGPGNSVTVTVPNSIYSCTATFVSGTSGNPVLAGFSCGGGATRTKGPASPS